MKQLSALTLWCLLWAARLGAQAAPAGYELANERVGLRVDQQGRIAELVNRQTGHAYIQEPGQPPWRLFYRTGTGYYRPGDALDLEIPPVEQPVRIAQEGDAIVLDFDSLTGHSARRGETRRLNVRLQIRIRLEGDRLLWTATVDNREPGIEISEIWTPWLNGVRDLGLGAEADVLYWPEGAGRRIVNPRAALATSAGGPSLKITYPWLASMAWFTLNNGEEGIYLASHDQTLMSTTLGVAEEGGRGLSLSIVKYPFVKTGESWSSEPAVLRLYRGSWHEAARTYRAWARTWLPESDPPRWLRRSPGWAHPALGRKGQSGHITGRYSDYPAMWRAAKASGLEALIVFGWVRQGFDNRYPEYEPDDEMGGAAELRQAIQEVEKAGGRIILYTQGQLLDPATAFYQTQGRRLAAKTIWGDDYREQYAFFGRGTFLEVMRNKYFSVACPSAPGWFEQLRSQFEMVKGYGAHGIIFDQMGGRPPYICFDPEHKHARPSLANAPGKLRNMRRLREIIKARDPEFAFVIELAADCYLPWVDIVHAWGPGFFPGPDSFGALLRYTFPEAVLTNRSGGSRDRKAQYGHAFTLGLRFDASTGEGQDPSLGPYLSRLCELRRQHAELLLEGRFVDKEGFLVSNDRVAAHGFSAGDRLAVALWNPEPNPQKVSVLAPGYSLETVSWLEAKWSGPDHTLKPNDVAVWIFRK